MKIRKTKLEDIESILTIVEAGRTYLASLGSVQWQNGYPNRASFEEDIKNGESYVLVDDDRDHVLGCMALSFREEKTYNVIDGAWLTNEAYGVIHRIAIDSSQKGKGLAEKFLEFSERKAIDNNVFSIKIDTHEKNSSMIKLIEKNDFKYCGVIIVNDGTQRVAFEKILVNR